MGILQTSDNMIKNSINLLDNVLNSNFTSFLDGMGKPFLVTYWNINDTFSTVDNGTGTIDEFLGDDSPIRYNKIENLPIYARTADWLPELESIEGNLLDISIDTELIVFPNSVRPMAGDFFIYTYGKRNLTFRVTEIKLGSLKNNDFYKISAELKDIDDNDYRNKLEKQTTNNFKAVLDKVGTNEKCLIESTVYDKIESVKKISEHLILNYIDTFYSIKYNAIILTKSSMWGYTVYDQYLTEFLTTSGVLDLSKNYYVLMNYDLRDSFRKVYNTTIFRNVELRNKKGLKKMRMAPARLPNTNTNPFEYYGEEVVFCLDVYEDKEFIDLPKNSYIDYSFIDAILNNEIKPSTDTYRSIIIKYFNNKSLVNSISNKELDALYDIEIDNCAEHFRLIPIILYILQKYVQELTI